MALTDVNWVDCEMLSGTAEGERSYLSTYQAISDDPQDGPLTVTTSPLLPSFTDHLVAGNDVDFGVFPVNYKAKRPIRTNRLNWEVYITFSTKGTKRHESYQDDPVLQAPIVSGGGVRFSRITMHDKDGNAITNSAGDVVVDVEMDDDRGTLRIQKNFATLELAQFHEFKNTVNDATFWGLGPREWKMSFPRWEQKFRGNNTAYYTVTFEFENSSEPSTDTWDKIIIDRGLFKVVNNVRSRVTDDKGRPFSTPQLLDGNGDQLAHGLVPVDLPPFELYPTKDFSQLGIPIGP